MKHLIPLAISVALVATLGACAPAQVPENQNQAVSSSSSSSVSSVIVSQPLPNAVVSSPLTVTGQASGWYFEGSFPVKLLDGNGNLLAQGPATASGDWMTVNFVPFTATLTFATPATSTGTLVLEKDNPSGLPQNAASMSIPVQF